jgi:peptide-methionine (R)-S-oxide reductase
MNTIKKILFSSIFLLVACLAFSQKKSIKYPEPKAFKPGISYPIHYTDQEWKKILTPQQYYILRQKGTERAGSGKYDHFYQKGIYYSAASLQPLFSSDTKFNSGTGWPSFFAPISADAVYLVNDLSDDMVRLEVIDS